MNIFNCNTFNPLIIREIKVENPSEKLKLENLGFKIGETIKIEGYLKNKKCFLISLSGRLIALSNNVCKDIEVSEND